MFAFRNRVNAEATGHRVRGNSKIHFTAFHFAGQRHPAFHVHLSAVRRFVLCKADVAVDARKIPSAARRHVEIRVHPRFFVVLFQILEKPENLRRKDRLPCRHCVSPCQRAFQRTSFPIPVNSTILSLRQTSRIRGSSMRRSALMLSVLLVVCISANLSWADEKSGSSDAKEPWKPEDIIYGETAAPQTRISPDGKWLVWVKSTGDKEKDARVSNLMLSSLTENKEIQLTRGNDNNGQPQWSPDGQLIAFTSNRARHGAKPDTAPVQLWLINPFGGAPWSITELARAPRRVDWLDKDTVGFSAQEDPSLYAQETKQKKDDSEVADDAEHEPPVRLFKISVKDKKITRLTTNTDWIGTWAVSKDGKFVAAVHEKSLHYMFDQKTPPLAVLHNLSDGTEKRIFAEGRVYPRGFGWLPDSSGFYAWAPFSTHPKFLTATVELLYYYDLAAGK